MDVERAKLHRGQPLFGKRPGPKPPAKKGVRSRDKVGVVLREVPEAILRERLLPMSVRELAIGVMHSDASVARALASLLPPPKARRLMAELDFLSRLDVGYAMYAAITDKVVGLLHGTGDVSHKSYIRPKGGDHRRGT